MIQSANECFVIEINIFIKAIHSFISKNANEFLLTNKIADSLIF